MSEMTEFSVDSELIDVTGLSLRELDEIPERRLADALRQVLDADDSGPVAGFNSRI